MKQLNISGVRMVCCALLLVGYSAALQAQDSTAVEAEAVSQPVLPKKGKPVKNTFESIWLIDEQTVEVPVVRTFEMDFRHRFGTVNNGYKDFYGLFASANISLGANYVPIKNLLVGVALTKSNMTWEGYAKYALLKQVRNGKGSPVSATWYAHMAIESKESATYARFSDRMSYFNQLIIARKISEKLSVQVAPGWVHHNVVDGYSPYAGKYLKEKPNDHFMVAVGGRFKLTESMSVIANYDQPLTTDNVGNAHPNISAGLELSTSGHVFQFFAGNYYYITPQRNIVFNQNDYTERQFLIGFNITRLWNY
ncbi:hypothetical protein SAMN05421788_10823 [Filimonas lacunae]|uniref:DUF5777 domain-containing protein n=1 Tax=Filimonas lacunae TaxID=477680 RepID=A0A173MEH5_9BACT|nr:DUF5777 family beta-barrel protein [Filimonas lacunae]BAV05838.1 hypothetical protein FLA_1850 [Filimonas lacunae]SIT28422.1 hypothetical protein SAMN05421788_10823 [Filimonas lacunae]